jgi:starch synthase
MSPLRICLVSSEVAPLAKTGGLADVVAALGAQLARHGHDVRVFMPLYRRLREAGTVFEPVPGLTDLPVSLGPRSGRVSVWKTTIERSGLEVLCIDCPELYDRPGIYTADDDEHLRFAVLARASLAACQATHWAPDIIHCNDWHAGLLPLYLKMLSSWERLFDHTKTVLTIHNIGYQGVVEASAMADLGLDDAAHLLHQEDLADGKINFLKTGLLYADVLTTVSRTYAQEIQTEELGMGLGGLLRSRADSLVGIVNGVDYGEWSPENDAFIERRYSAETLDDKQHNKRALQASMGLAQDDGALTFGIVSRLVHQKGFELLFDPLREMLAAHDVRVTVLGSGEEKYERYFDTLQRRFPKRMCFYQGYDNRLAHVIEAGADVFLMPSLYEPCGLNQMYSLKYGTVPIVRRTGGLADTVQLFNRSTGEGTGIVFDHFEADAARRALIYALELYAEPGVWRRLMLNGMAQDFSWQRQTQIYEALYHRLLAGAAAGRS